MTEARRICIDLDGTICSLQNRKGDYENAVPLPGAVDTIRALRAAGHYVIILTARRMRTCAGDVAKVEEMVGDLTRNWLARHGVEYDELIFGKPYAHLYIDDLAHRFDGDWDAVSTRVEDMQRVESDPAQ